MKKTTKTILKAILLFVICADSFAADETLVASIQFGSEIPDLTAISNTTYKASESEVQFSFNAINSIYAVENECFGSEKNYYGLYFDIKANTDGEYNPYPNGTLPGINQAWMFIENLGSKPITKIVLKGTSLLLDSDLFCDFELTDGQSAQDWNNGIVQFKQASVCQDIVIDLTTYDAIEGWDDFAPYTYEDVKTVRLTRSAVTGDTKNGKPFIQSIEVYTEDGGIPSSIDRSELDNMFTYSRRGDMLEFNRPVNDICVYDISGKVCLTVYDRENISVSGLPRGLYIVKAEGKDGKVLTVKIAK